MKKLLIFSLISIFSSLLCALPKSGGAAVQDSVIDNKNENVVIDARNGSNVNTGIQARGARIKSSSMVNRFSGQVNARNNSRVNAGIKADGATVKNTSIEVDTKANINANNSTVKTGVDINEASNSTIKTRYRGTINAHHGTAKAASVEGSVNNKKISTNVDENVTAVGRTVEIGTVKAGNGRPSNWKNENGVDFSRGHGAKSSVGNVTVDSNRVREVDTEVGTNNFMKGLKTKHMSKVYKDQGGVDPSGTKHVYVDSRQKEKVKQKGGSAGDTHVGRGESRIRKINTYVE